MNLKPSLSRFILIGFLLLSFQVWGQHSTVWQIGKKDNAANEFALTPSAYNKFVTNFGGENTVYNIGYSTADKHWPYVLPGPLDNWAGGGYWAGFYPRHFPRIFFQLPQIASQQKFVFTIGFNDVNNKNAPSIRIDINGHSTLKQLQPGSGKLLTNPNAPAQPQTLTVEVPSTWLKTGLNCIQIGSKTGSWAVFDYISFESDKTLNTQPRSHVETRAAAGFDEAGGDELVIGLDHG